MKIIRAALRYDLDLRAGSASRLRCVQLRVHTKLRDRIFGDHQAALALRLIPNRGGIDAVDTVVDVVAALSEEADARSVSRARIDSAGRQGHQAAPVAPVNGKLADLRVVERRGDSGGGSIEIRFGDHLDR